MEIKYCLLLYAKSLQELDDDGSPQPPNMTLNSFSVFAKGPDLVLSFIHASLSDKSLTALPYLFGLQYAL